MFASLRARLYTVHYYTKTNPNSGGLLWPTSEKHVAEKWLPDADFALFWNLRACKTRLGHKIRFVYSPLLFDFIIFSVDLGEYFQTWLNVVVLVSYKHELELHNTFSF